LGDLLLNEAGRTQFCRFGDGWPRITAETAGIARLEESAIFFLMAGNTLGVLLEANTRNLCNWDAAEIAVAPKGVEVHRDYFTIKVSHLSNRGRRIEEPPYRVSKYVGTQKHLISI
jgi:hypothetical protein